MSPRSGDDGPWGRAGVGSRDGCVAGSGGRAGVEGVGAVLRSWGTSASGLMEANGKGIGMRHTTHTKQITQVARQEVRGGRRPDEPRDRKRPRPRARVSAGQPAGAAAGVPVVLLAGLDWLTLTSRARVSEAMYARLAEAKATARLEEREGRVYCPSWLDARLRPSGAKGYPFLIETEDFTVKVAGEQQRTWPGLSIELRSHFLHTHPAGAHSACEEALGWVCSQLLYDQDEAVREEVAWETVNVSRADLHVDWQGGFLPTFAAGEERRFIRPRSLLWHPYIVGTTCQGYRFGGGDPLMARIYNKTAECRRRHDEGYTALLAAHNGERYDPSHEVWRLEFELKREALASLKLAAALDTEDAEADIEAELSAEELPHVGTLPKLFAHLDAIFQHLTYHWLRLVQPSRGRVRSRWPLDPTWQALRREFAATAAAPRLDELSLAVVRGARYSGRNRLLNRMAAGLLASLEREDASVASASLARLQAWAEREAQRMRQRRVRLLTELGQQGQLDVLSDDELRARLGEIAAGRGVAEERSEVLRQRLQELLGIWAQQGVVPLEVRSVASVEELVRRHLAGPEGLEALAKEKGGVAELLRQHFAKAYKAHAPAQLFAAS